ncbi:hypothetical protein [Salinivibrio proteolyticus]|uniref:hypothetical protein n=1 Tax=Salinivibrio proteolyticus TaxID=334715 RepID=UPI001E62A1CD|nr:hypothetical protein [Salinivibrio proteolyticus]
MNDLILFAKPSQAKPSQAKPSQAKPSQAKPNDCSHCAVLTRLEIWGAEWFYIKTKRPIIRA